MNILTLYGRLGRDAEEKILDSGQRLLALNLAVKSRRGGTEETLWWRVTVWGDRFKRIEPYFKKGAALVVTGSMGYPRIYQDQNGSFQPTLEVTAQSINFNPFRPEETQDGQATQAPSPKPADKKAEEPEYGFKDDEIPF